MKLYKLYIGEDTWNETSLEDERDILKDWFKDVDLLADTSIYTAFEAIPPTGYYSFRTSFVLYAWVTA